MERGRCAKAARLSAKRLAVEATKNTNGAAYRLFFFLHFLSERRTAQNNEGFDFTVCLSSTLSTLCRHFSGSTSVPNLMLLA